MAGELAEAIGLQGIQKTPNSRALFWDTVKMGEMGKEQERQKKQRQQKEDEEFDKLLNNSIKVDYTKYHKTDIPLAYEAQKQVIKQLAEAKASGDPTWKNNSANMFNDLALQLGKLTQASKAKFDFEKYKQDGGFTDKDADNYYEYLKTNNPAYLKGIDLTRSSVISAIDPETGAAAFNPFKRRDLPAAIRQNVFTDKVEQVGKNAGGFTEMVSYFDPADVETKAATLFQDPEIRQNFEATVKGKIIDQLGNTLYKGKLDQYTLNSPEFQNDYEQALLGEFVNYAKTLEPKTVNLSRNPKDNITNINVGSGSPIGDTIAGENIEISFGDTAGNTKTAISGRSYGLEGQKILIPKGEYLTNIQNGERLSQKGATDATVSGIYVLPVYDEGTKIKGYGANNKLYDYGNTLVGKDDIESGRAGNILKYQYKPIAFIKIGNSTYYGDAEKLTGASRYFDASEAEKPLVVKTFEQAKQDALERNKGIGSKSKPTPAPKPNSKKPDITDLYSD